MNIDKMSNIIGGFGEWEQPEPFDNFSLPAFPVDAIPPLFREFIDQVCESIQVAVDMPAVSCLGVVATAIQKKFNVEGKSDHIEPLNIYSLIIAPPSERKSAFIRIMTRPIYEYQEQKTLELQGQIDKENINMDIAQRGLTKAIKNEDYMQAREWKERIRELEAKKTYPVRLTADNITVEALTTALCENKGRLSIYSAEGGLFDILAGVYNSGVTNIDTVLKAHAGDNIMVDRKGRASECIDNPCLTIILSLQDSIIESLLANTQFRGRGLVDRMLFCKPKSIIGKRKYEENPKIDYTKYTQAINKLLNIDNNDTYTLKLCDKAKEVNKAWFDELEPLLKDDLYLIGGWAGKLHGATLRIAGILHAMDNIDNPYCEVQEHTMSNAVKIGRYFLEHAKFAYNLMGTNKGEAEAKYVLDKIKAHNLIEGNKQDIKRICRKYYKTDELLPALEILEQKGYIRKNPQEWSGTGRKPAYIYKVNPFVFDT